MYELSISSIIAGLACIYNSRNFETEETCGCLEQKETDYQMYRKAKYFLITVRVKEEKPKLPPKEFSSLNQ